MWNKVGRPNSQDSPLFQKLKALDTTVNVLYMTKVICWKESLSTTKITLWKWGLKPWALSDIHVLGEVQLLACPRLLSWRFLQIHFWAKEPGRRGPFLAQGCDDRVLSLTCGFSDSLLLHLWELPVRPCVHQGALFPVTCHLSGLDSSSWLVPHSPDSLQSSLLCLCSYQLLPGPVLLLTGILSCAVPDQRCHQHQKIPLWGLLFHFSPMESYTSPDDVWLWP